MTGLAEVAARAASRGIPLTVHLELTHRCNARCIHCLQDRDAAPAELGLAEWCSVLDQARRLGVLFVTLSGGEAMLSSHFWEVFAYARRLGLATRLLTNGLRLDRPTVARIAALFPLSVEVSVFSVRAERHDAVTGVPGSLSRAIRGLVALGRAGVPTVIKCPLVVGAGEDHAAVRQLAARVGGAVVFDPQILASVDGRAGPTRCRGDDGFLDRYFSHPATVAHDAPRASPLRPEQVPCGMGLSFVAVGPSGDVKPCVALPFTAGSVREAPLERIWHESPLFAALRARRFGTLPVCGGCPRSGYCDRCSALALLEDGDIDGPSTRACQVAEARERAWGVPRPAGAPAPVRRPLRVLPS